MSPATFRKIYALVTLLLAVAAAYFLASEREILARNYQFNPDSASSQPLESRGALSPGEQAAARAVALVAAIAIVLSMVAVQPRMAVRVWWYVPVALVGLSLLASVLAGILAPQKLGGG